MPVGCGRHSSEQLSTRITPQIAMPGDQRLTPPTRARPHDHRDSGVLSIRGSLARPPIAWCRCGRVRQLLPRRTVGARELLPHGRHSVGIARSIVAAVSQPSSCRDLTAPPSSGKSRTDASPVVLASSPMTGGRQLTPQPRGSPDGRGLSAVGTRSSAQNRTKHRPLTSVSVPADGENDSSGLRLCVPASCVPAVDPSRPVAFIARNRLQDGMPEYHVEYPGLACWLA
ncbi:hypothetical protein Ae707Ps1_5920 [Pseudonocardia sp. Ae707_Ps1]|nr:hypothetical protein Ae707Ps1_5920 [Pseudonocardia sp. Ae707_Ps1]